MNFSKNIIWSPVEYAEAAVIAREASEEMLTRLDWMTIKPKVILDMGCGIGESSLSLRQRYPQSTVLACDLSMSMIQYAKQHSSRIDCVCAEGESLPLRDQSVDLIFANFFLPWQSDVKTILREWLRVLSPNGLLLVSALGLDTLREWRDVLRQEHTPVWVDMHDIGDALLQAGFSDPVLDVHHCQVTYRDKKRLVGELVTSGMWFPGDEKEIEQVKQSSMISEEVYSLTYEVIHAHAFRPEVKDEYAPEEDGIVKIPLAHLRRKLSG
jgi:malonyl-CoA O-methyltransferase